jgi:putative PEP-CTERM system TPR-repeat lipoprotein
MPRKDRLDALQAAVKADSSNVLAQIALIDFFAEAGEHQAAADAAQQALSASPDNVDLVIRQGRAQLAMGNRDQALASFAKALSVSPNAVDAHLGRAEASLAARQFADAERSVASALDRAPDNPDVLRAQARLRIAQQQYDAAIASAKAIQRLRPDSAIGFEIQGDIHLFQGRYEAAAQVLKTVLSKADPGKSALKFHHALLKSGQHDAAERFATEWTRDHPQDHEFVFYLGDSAQQRGNAREAEARYLQALAVQDDYLPALNNLALLLSARRDPRARGLIERALALAPTDPQLIDSMAQVLRDEGRLNEAIETQHRAVRLAPKNGQLRLHLAHLMIDANDPTAARAEIRAVSDPQGGFSAAEREQARALLRSLSR